MLARLEKRRSLRPHRGAKAWTESKVKEKADITRLAAKASVKVEAKEELRVTENSCAAKIAVE